ncbi:hypothetical protein ANACOL_00451 [Anaerotruncus colihominis DSM 17241]|uniref:Uncharacterized protein n=1 Tax=Anaerotruncus colihominis DSM 17241 TaxID=445972 RepID=B0P6S3_9FIRM|nr:hypothetical protein ANACOL_00451 [Anaerotruncus colihominis DSM 17241]
MWGFLFLLYTRASSNLEQKENILSCKEKHLDILRRSLYNTQKGNV